MYKKLEKIVNKINGNKPFCRVCEGKGKIEETDYNGGFIGYKDCKCDYEDMLEYKEIHLEDILLSLRKKYYVVIEFSDLGFEATCMYNNECDEHKFSYDLSKQLSQQKEEVYNQLIKILTNKKTMLEYK